MLTGVAWADGLLCIAGHYLGSLETTADGVREIQVMGDYAFLADRSGGLVIADVSDPSNPVTVSALPEVGFALDVLVDGDTVYVGTGGSGLAVVDATDRSSPTILGRYEGVIDVIDIAGGGNVVYLACNDDGIRVLDISDPANPMELAAVMPGGQLYSVAVFEHADDELRLCAPFWGGGLRIYDVNDPSNPVDIGSIENDRPYFGVAVENDIVCVLNRNSGLEIYQVSPDGQPVFLGGASYLPTLAYDIEFDGQTALVSDRHGVREFDVTDPTHPWQVFAYPTDGFAYGFDFVGNMVYVGNDAQGMQVFERVAQGPILGEPLKFGSDLTVAGRDGYLYVNELDELTVMRIDGPSEMEEVASITVGVSVASPSAMHISGNRLYLGAPGTRDVTVVDIGDPAEPVLLGVSRFDSAGSANLISEGNLVFAATQALEVRDLTDPSAGLTLSVTPLSSFTRDRQLEGDMLYLVVNEAGLMIFDVADPVSPALLGTYPDSGENYFALDVRGGVAYLGGLDGSVDMVDVSDPMSPIFLAGLNLSGQVIELAAYGDKLFVSANFANGQTLIDVSDPAQPELLIEANELGTVGSVYIEDDVAYIGQFRSVTSYDLSGCSCPADLTGDGRLTFFDVSQFLVAYLANEADGDWNGDGAWNFFDLSAFIQDFNAGCP
ncbi:MAG: GC-type dockerin domain-anchored protein [Phycisphaerales bacterium]